MSWKKDVIKIAEGMAETKNIREYFQAECQRNCHVVNYNHHCPQCSLIKYLGRRKTQSG